MSFLAVLVLAWLIALLCCVLDLLGAEMLGEQRNAWVYCLILPILFAVVLFVLCVQLYATL